MLTAAYGGCLWLRQQGLTATQLLGGWTDAPQLLGWDTGVTLGNLLPIVIAVKPIVSNSGRLQPCPDSPAYLPNPATHLEVYTGCKETRLGNTV